MECMGITGDLAGRSTLRDLGLHPTSPFDPFGEGDS